MTGCVVLQSSLIGMCRQQSCKIGKKVSIAKFTSGLSNEESRKMTNKVRPFWQQIMSDQKEGKETSKVTTCRQRIGNWTTPCSSSLPGASQVPMSGQATP
jgi:hypothetical protein